MVAFGEIVKPGLSPEREIPSGIVNYINLPATTLGTSPEREGLSDFEK